MASRTRPAFFAPVAPLAALVHAAAGQVAALPNAGVPSAEPCPVVLPSAPSLFTDETAARGIEYIVGNPGSGFGFYAMGAATFADLDDDGDEDILAVGALNGRVAFYENDGTGHFITRGVIGLFVPYGADILAFDYDSDGDLDLFISCYRDADIMLRNDGNWQFTNVTAAAGVAGFVAPGGGSSVADVNGDGLLDLYVANRTGTSLPGFGISAEPNRLFINQGDGTFSEQYAALGLSTGMEPTLLGVFIDFDLDGDPDLYEGNDKGSFCNQTRNELYENVGGTFVKITDASGTQSCTDTMGIAIGDYDRNGWPDMYCTHLPQAPGNTLFLNQGDGTFVQDAAGYGVDSLAMSWGTLMFDHDNDGDLAIYVCNIDEPDRLFDYQGSWPAVDIGPAMGLYGGGDSYNVAKADVDLDGDLDLLVQIVPGPTRLYINNEGQKRNWVSLKIRGDSVNTHAVGALVEIRVGNEWQTSQVLVGGNSYRGQNSMDQHFGLDDACSVDEITVRWPDGQTRVLTNYPANARYEIVRVGALGDPDGDGNVSAAEVAGLVGAMGPVTRESAVFDFDGNGVINGADLRSAVRRSMRAK